MKKLLLLLLPLMIVLTSCARTSVPPPLPLLGDAAPYTFTGRSYAIADVIDARASQFSLLAIAYDGFAVQLHGDELNGVLLRYRNGWQLHAPQHPPSANIENIAQLVIISQSNNPYAVRLIDADGQVREITAGQLFLQPQHRVLYKHGMNQLNERSATVFTMQYHVSLSDMLAGESFAVMARNGETLHFRGNAHLLSHLNQVNLHLPDDRILHDIVGIIADAPTMQITQLYHDAMHFIAQGQPVLAIKIDGLGWDMLEHAPFIQSLNPQRALAVWPPITPAGLASMLTGETPDIHGIATRGQRNLLVDDIFTHIPNSVHIGARSSFINSSLPPQLTISDGDAFMLAQQALADPVDFIFVHFKQVDSTAHYHGPHAEQTRQAIAEIDEFVRLLAAQFDGRIIVTSDHGLHDTPNGGGNHGLFLPQDMLVPYAVR